MAENPYEAPTEESSLERRPIRRYRRWPWPYKIALAIGSTVTTIVVLFLLTEYLTVLVWLQQQARP
jgi:hypothetical protein